LPRIASALRRTVENSGDLPLRLELQNQYDVARTLFSNREGIGPWTGIALKEVGSRQVARSKKSGASSLTMISRRPTGKREQFEGRIQERYGIAKDQVRKDVDTWLNSLD
jgi:hypothetical protein